MYLFYKYVNVVSSDLLTKDLYILFLFSNYSTSKNTCQYKRIWVGVEKSEEEQIYRKIGFLVIRKTNFNKPKIEGFYFWLQGDWYVAEGMVG